MTKFPEDKETIAKRNKAYHKAHTDLMNSGYSPEFIKLQMEKAIKGQKLDVPLHTLGNNFKQQCFRRMFQKDTRRFAVCCYCKKTFKINRIKKHHTKYCSEKCAEKGYKIVRLESYKKYYKKYSKTKNGKYLLAQKNKRRYKNNRINILARQRKYYKKNKLEISRRRRLQYKMRKNGI